MSHCDNNKQNIFVPLNTPSRQFCLFYKRRLWMFHSRSAFLIASVYCICSSATTTNRIFSFHSILLRANFVCFIKKNDCRCSTVVLLILTINYLTFSSLFSFCPFLNFHRLLLHFCPIVQLLPSVFSTGLAFSAGFAFSAVASAVPSAVSSGFTGSTGLGAGAGFGTFIAGIIFV